MGEPADQFELDEQSISSLLSEARAGSAPSRAQLLEQLHGYLSWLAKNQLEPDLNRKLGPSDIVQQSYLLAFDNFDNFRGTTPDELRGWLRQILVNELKKQRRKFRSKKRDVEREQTIHPDSRQRLRGTDPADELPTPGTQAVAEEEAAVLDQAMQRLPESYRTVIELKNWERLSFKEIGERMDRSAEASAKLWYRALAKLQEEMESLQ